MRDEVVDADASRRQVPEALPIERRAAVLVEGAAGPAGRYEIRAPPLQGRKMRPDDNGMRGISPLQIVPVSRQIFTGGLRQCISMLSI